ncbi:MAG: ATP-binding protein [Verrucomicrobiota bacterium]
MIASTEQAHFRLSRLIASRLDAVDTVCGEIRKLVELHRLTPVSFALELVARECLNNAVIHGNRREVGKWVRLQLRCRRGRICLRVTDEGSGFDWRTARWEEPADNIRPRGRGLPILASYAERIRFNREGNQITLWLRPSQ